MAMTTIAATDHPAAAKAALMGWRPMTLFERATSSMITSDIGVPMPPMIDAVKSTLIGGAPRRPASAWRFPDDELRQLVRCFDLLPTFAAE